jgi:hypothetical protein
MSWLLVVLIVSILVGVARGGKLANVAEIHARGWFLLFLAFGMQVFANALPEGEINWAVALILTSYVVLLVTVWLNRALPGALLAGIGIAMNFIVIAWNRGMPVSTEAISLAGGSPDTPLDAKHVLLDSQSAMPFLADIIPLPGTVISIGDVLLGVGIGIFIEYQLRQPRPLFRKASRTGPGSAY